MSRNPQDPGFVIPRGAIQRRSADTAEPIDLEQLRERGRRRWMETSAAGKITDVDPAALDRRFRRALARAQAA